MTEIKGVYLTKFPGDYLVGRAEPAQRIAKDAPKKSTLYKDVRCPECLVRLRVPDEAPLPKCHQCGGVMELVIGVEGGAGWK